MRKLLLTALLFASLSQAQEITAFGYTLGDKIADDFHGKTEEISTGVRFYVTPKEGFKHEYFDTYIVDVSPKSRLIHQVGAWKDGLSKDDCRDKQEVLSTVIEAKYKHLGEMKLDYVIDEFTEYAIRTEDIQIRVACYDNQGLSLFYSDTKGRQKGHDENIEVQAEKTNTKAL